MFIKHQWLSMRALTQLKGSAPPSQAGRNLSRETQQGSWFTHGPAPSSVAPASFSLVCLRVSRRPLKLQGSSLH